MTDTTPTIGTTELIDAAPGKQPEQISHVVVRFAGDSGDGMQLTGDRFTSASALFGNDLSTFPDYPAEIRAPSRHRQRCVQLPGAHLRPRHHHPGRRAQRAGGDEPGGAEGRPGHRLEQNGLLIVNSDAFETRDLEKAGYDHNPLHDDFLSSYRLVEIPMTSLTQLATEPLGVKARDSERSKNFFALGLVSWLYSRPIEPTLEWIDGRFKDLVKASNLAAFKAGYNFGETSELFDHPYQVKPAQLPPGEYTNISRQRRVAWGLVAAGQLAKLPLFLGSYPITPASDILHELSKHKHFGVRTVQAEDEIAAIGMAIGAAFAGHLGITTTSGPGLDLKSETISLGGQPGTAVAHRRHPARRAVHRPAHQDRSRRPQHRDVRPPRRSPLPIVAAYSVVAVLRRRHRGGRIALKYRTPVILLSDGYLANGSEPWLLPEIDTLPDISVPVRDRDEPCRRRRHAGVLALPARPRDAGPPVGHPRHAKGLMHRVGGIEKQDGTGNISYSPPTTARWCDLRAAEGRGHRQRHAPLAVDRRRRRRRAGARLGQHLGGDRRRRATHLREGHEGGCATSPTSTRCRRTSATLHAIVQEGAGARTEQGPAVPMMLRAEYLIDVQSLHQVKGLPFTSSRHWKLHHGGTCPMSDTIDRPAHARRRTTRPTRRCGGAPAAATTASCTRCRR
jgi:2-oxoglutarate ferredoxin oxidoreductase subunit alpha